MKLLLTILIIAAAGRAFDGSVYSFSLTTIEGQADTLQAYAGKQILITELPATQTADDTAFLQRIDSIALANAGTLQVIGVPSYEDGYADSMLATLQPFYRTFLDSSVVISTGMYTHQSSGAAQSPLFSWLTHVSGNTHFEQEVGGPGITYYLTQAGELHGVIGPEAKYSNLIVNNMLQ